MRLLCSRLLATALTVVSLVTLGAVTPARAAPNQFIGCSFGIDKPFFVTKNSNKMYTQGGVAGCTNPAPQACKLTIELTAKNGALWIVVAQKVTGWQSCGNKKPVTTPAFICHAYPAKTEFAGQATLQVEINGTFDSSTKGSGVVEFYCAP
jgi:hypothetical protein